MKKLTLMACLAVMIAAYLGCKRSSDVLATFTGGQITRGEFYEWMDARRMAKDSIRKNKSQQRSSIERFVLEKLMVQEAKKAGYDKNEEFQYLMTHALRNFYSQFLSRQISEEGSFKEKAAKTRIIKFLVKDYTINNNKREKLTDAALDAAVQEKVERAKSVLQELQKGESFENLAKKYSDDFSKKKGGDIGYVIEGMRGEDFSKAVFAVKKGEYTKDPVIIGNAVYIIMVDDIVEVTADNIEKIIEDNSQQMSLKRRLMYNSSLKYQNTLMKAKDVENHSDDVNFNDPNAVIFKVGKQECKVSDMNKLINYIMMKRTKMGRTNMNIDDKLKRELSKRMLREELLMREVLKRGIEKDEKFKKELQFFNDYNLAGNYESDVILTGIIVTPQDIKDYYNKNLDKIYTRSVNEGGKTVKRITPFEQVQQNIEFRLQEMKRSEKRKAWMDDMLKKNNYKLDESELEGKDDNVTK